MSLTTGDQETYSLTDHKTGGVDLDVDGILNKVEYLLFHDQWIAPMSFK